jgi:putative ABC transport system substrate-binding protein
MAIGIGRREFLALVTGAGIMPAVPSRAQQRDRARTVGFLMGLPNDAQSEVRIKAFEQGLAKEGWTLGQDIRTEYRFASSDASRMRAFAAELIGLQPDVIVGHSTPVVEQLVQATRTIPIVFVVVADPVGSGFVASIARPRSNATGFTNLAASITGKLLTILKQIKPDLSRVALLFSPDASISAGRLFLHPLEAAAPSFSVKVIPAQARGPADIERHMTELAREPNTGLIVMPDNFTTMHRQLIISLAARLRIPAVYPYRFFAESGGLMSYGVDVTDLFRRSSEYVSRILRGETPGDLPVQAPNKFELVINLRTAKTLGLVVPRILLVGADALIE